MENIKERNTNFEIDKIQENIVLQNENLNEILQKYNKEFNKNNLFEEMNLMMKKSLEIKKEEKYESIYNNYKKNLDKIFKEQLDNKAIKNISDKEQLNLFSMNYFYDYLQYYFSYQLINNGYEKLKIDNKSLMNMTKTLLSIVDDILSSNYEMVTTNNIHANALNFIKTPSKAPVKTIEGKYGIEFLQDIDGNTIEIIITEPEIVFRVTIENIESFLLVKLI